MFTLKGEPLTQEQLDEILKKHSLWLQDAEGGERADLRYADLSFAALSSADLRSANLSYANLSYANLSSADLRYADLSFADLSSAALSSADLRYANLRYADLRSADLTMFRDDLWAVISSAPREVEGLLSALKEGRIDGSTYTGECACLVGTIANIRHVNYVEIPSLTPDTGRLAEVWFIGISKGDTPETNAFAKSAVEWIETWPPLEFIRAAAAGSPVSDRL